MNTLNDNNNLGIVIGIVIFLIVILIIYIFINNRITTKNLESFKNDYFYLNKKPGYKDITGPSLDNNDITGWQFNPQSTLINYDFYKTNEDLEYLNKRDNLNLCVNSIKKTQKIAPIGNGDVGILTNPSYQFVNDLEENSTRVPSTFSTDDHYIIPNSTTHPELEGASVSYNW
jgi:hypothetical protein